MRRLIYILLILLINWGCSNEGERRGKQISALQLNTYSSSFPFYIPSTIIDPIQGNGGLYLFSDRDDLIFHFEFQSDQGLTSKFSGTFTGVDEFHAYDPKEGFKEIQAFKARIYEKGQSENIILYADLEKNLIQVSWFEQRKDGIIVSHELTGGFEDQPDAATFENKRELLSMTKFLSKVDSARNVIPERVLEALDSLGY